MNESHRDNDASTELQTSKITKVSQRQFQGDSGFSIQHFTALFSRHFLWSPLCHLMLAVAGLSPVPEASSSFSCQVGTAVCRPQASTLYAIN